jgi:hypothetical protein
MKRRSLTKEMLSPERFNILVRFMVVAAEKKRFVEYNELNKAFGIPLEDLRDYARILGDYCYENDLPYLNSLIINTTEGKPGNDFNSWIEGKDSSHWGDLVAECLKEFHLPQGNHLRFQNTSELNDSINKFLKR